MLHYDSDYDLIAKITNQPTRWVVPRSTASGRQRSPQEPDAGAGNGISALEGAPRHHARMDRQGAIDAIVAWAREDENIRLVVLAGSAAGDADAADSLSDLDVELYVREPNVLLQDRSWHRRFGHLLVREELSNAGWNPTRLLYYIDGKIDFTIIDLAHLERAIHDRPVCVLLDREQLALRLRSTPGPTEPLTPTAVEECVNWFYAAALMEAKQLVRGELWQAKFREWDLLRQLLRMIAWNHTARYGADYDTWFNGKHFAQWMDRDIRAASERCWSRFDVDDMHQALTATLGLFAALEPPVAAAASVEPFDHAPVAAEVDRILTLRSWH